MAKSKPRFIRVAQLKSVEDFQDHMSALSLAMPFKDTLSQPGKSSLGQSFILKSGRIIGNRFCILPMEGWDGTSAGQPSEHTKRRWRHFATSGAKLLWGCEAVAVRHDGRANPNQLLINKENLGAFKSLYQDLVADHETKFGTSSDLMIGLQLTHSGRFSVPDQDRIKKPKIVYRHPILDDKFNIPKDFAVLSDAEIDTLIDDFVNAASLAKEAGFQFVDIKHCHGYLGHEFLSAYDRAGKYGGSLENRLRFLTSIVEGIRATSNIAVGVRLSAVDFIPFTKGPGDIGEPVSYDKPYQEAFGGDGVGTGIDLTEVFKVLEHFRELDIELVCITAGSPYYTPHLLRPALFPPSDGYLPPEDPLVGVARQIEITNAIKKRFPDLVIVGSAYSYLQEWLPHVAEAVIDGHKADFVGLGRMVLSYPELANDILKGNALTRGKICRTFSDCTTGPRIGMLSGCFPLDPYYKEMQEAKTLKDFKKNMGL